MQDRDVHAEAEQQNAHCSLQLPALEQTEVVGQAFVPSWAPAAAVNGEQVRMPLEPECCKVIAERRMPELELPVDVCQQPVPHRPVHNVLQCAHVREETAPGDRAARVEQCLIA